MNSLSHPTSEGARAVLRQRFGYDAFREGQAEIIDAILASRDCVGVMPTGAGKSLCYQVPALLLPGITLVVSPLVSLMHDQVSALVKSGIPAAYVNSQMPAFERAEVLDRAAAGEFSLLYIAPERLEASAFLDFAQRAPITLVAVDEAHCVSQWGQDFRPSYLGIAEFIASLPHRPVVAAFTATATPRVAEDIARLLDLREPFALTTGFDRPNLRFEVEQLSDKKKLSRLLVLVQSRPSESGIVYCSTRKQVEQLHEQLVVEGVAATRYHAGLSPAERDANQRAFVNDDAPVIVATNAFGMGIDKSNVRYVVHYNMPGSLEAYYQEAGRAGRDGEPSECLLFWNDSDIATCRYFIEQDVENDALSADELAIVRAAQRRRLAAMSGYCMTTDCLRATILRYFGDSAPNPTATELAPACGNCSNCTDAIEAVDVTKTARSVMRCVHEMRGRFGKSMVADILTGSKSAKIREYGLETARTYDVVEDSVATVKEIIELLTAGDYLEISEGRYPLVGLGPRARQAATDDFRLYMKRKPKASRSAGPRASKRPAPNVLETAEQQELFERLRKLRKQLADEEQVPPYIVFSDAALRSMCTLMPRTEEEFLQVDGVGPVKLARYGEPFLAEIAHPSS